MTSAWAVDNSWVGTEPLLSFEMETDGSEDVTETDLEALQVSGLDIEIACACVITDNNTVGLGSSGEKLFGGIKAVSRELDSNDIPKRCSVAARGLVPFLYAGTAPVVNGMVEVLGTGKVQKAAADADIAAGGHLMRGQVVALDTTNTIAYVWLG